VRLFESADIVSVKCIRPQRHRRPRRPRRPRPVKVTLMTMCKGLGEKTRGHAGGRSEDRGQVGPHFTWGEWTAVVGAACRGVEGQSRDGEGVRVQNFYWLTKIYISFVCTLGGKGGMGRGRWRERERLRERGRELKKCKVYFDPWGGGGVFVYVFLASLLHFFYLVNFCCLIFYVLCSIFFLGGEGKGGF